MDESEFLTYLSPLKIRKTAVSPLHISFPDFETNLIVVRLNVALHSVHWLLPIVDLRPQMLGAHEYFTEV